MRPSTAQHSATKDIIFKAKLKKAWFSHNNKSEESNQHFSSDKIESIERRRVDRTWKTSNVTSSY